MQVEGVEKISNQVIIHEKFDGRMTRENDIALLRLTSDIQYEGWWRSSYDNIST